MSRLRTGSSIGPFPYRIVKQLGAGSGNMSDVYLATTGEPDPNSSYVVIKISKAQEDQSEFFEDTIFNEAERLRKLDHRGVVRIRPIQTENRMRVQPYAARASNLLGNPWFLVLEHLIGGSLAEVLQNYKQLDIALSIEITRKVAQTLEYLHYNDLVHLDLKPGNILFRHPLETGERVEPVLIDFGIARNTGQSGLEGRTLHYAPPERVLNRNAPPEILPRPSPAMDIYSLGVVFYQMLAGRRPFDGRTVQSIDVAILAGKPPLPSKYSNLVCKELDDLVMEMLSKYPIQRPTAGELVERLEALQLRADFQPSSSPSGNSIQIAAARPRSTISKIILTFGIVLALSTIPITIAYLIQFSITNLTKRFTAIYISVPTPTSSYANSSIVVVTNTPTVNITFTSISRPTDATDISPTQVQQNSVTPVFTVWEHVFVTSTPVANYPTQTPIPTFTVRPTSTPVPEIQITQVP